MVEKSGFYGDVGQVVVGNVIEVARQCNVVNLTIGGARTAPQALTKLQRQDVTAKVKAVVALDGAPALDVYCVLLNSFGTASIKAFPEDKSMAAIPCVSCTWHATEIKRVRATAVAQWALLLGATLLCGWLLLPSIVDAAPEFSAETRCFVDGKAHSMGSFIMMPNGSIRECMNNGPGGVPHWSTGAKK